MNPEELENCLDIPSSTTQHMETTTTPQEEELGSPNTAASQPSGADKIVSEHKFSDSKFDNSLIVGVHRLTYAAYYSEVLLTAIMNAEPIQWKTSLLEKAIVAQS